MKEKSVREFQYNIQDPLVTFYREIENLEELGKASLNPYLPSQLINFALQIIKNTNDFEDAQKQWHAKATGDKTWSNFMTHFDDEHQALREVRGVTMRSTAFHANAVSNEVLEEVRGMNATVQQAMMMMQNQTPPNTQPPVTQEHVNFAPSNNNEVSSEILLFLKKLQDEVESLKTSKQSSYRKRTKVGKYCWSHGGCNHTGKECKTGYRKRGHIEDATFENKQGGSTLYCPKAS